MASREFGLRKVQMLSELRFYPTLFLKALPFQRNGLEARPKIGTRKGAGDRRPPAPFRVPTFGESPLQAIPLKWQSSLKQGWVKT